MSRAQSFSFSFRIGAGIFRRLTVICTYVPPRGSAAVSSQDPAIWELLGNMVSEALVNSDVILLEDMNARTGLAPDFPGAF